MLTRTLDSRISGSISVPQKQTPKAVAKSCSAYFTSASCSSSQDPHCWPGACFSGGEAWAPMWGTYVDKEDTGLEALHRKAKTKLQPPPRTPSRAEPAPATPPAGRGSGPASASGSAPPGLRTPRLRHPGRPRPSAPASALTPTPTEGDGRQRSSRGCHHGCGGRAGGRPNLS